MNLKTNRHTAKKISHTHTSYRGLILVLIVFSFAFIFVQNLAVKADDTITVTASVPAPLPTIPPVITSPTDNSKIFTSTVMVSGICQILTPPSIIALYRGDTFLGSGSCSKNGTFATRIDLVEGPNVITPKSFNVFGTAGLVGSPVTIFYNSLNPVVDNFSLTTDMPFVTYRVNKQFKWSVDISGGKEPYKLFVNWGDGTDELVKVPSPGRVFLFHEYANIKQYTIRATAIDNTGSERSLEVLALTLEAPKKSEVLGITHQLNWLKDIPTIYVLLVSIFIALIAFRMTPWLVSRHWIEVFDSRFGKFTLVFFLVVPFGIVLLMLAAFIYHWLLMYL